MKGITRRITSIIVVVSGFYLLCLCMIMFMESAFVEQAWYKQRRDDLKSCYQDPACDYRKREIGWDEGYFAPRPMPATWILGTGFSVIYSMFGLWLWPRTTDTTDAHGQSSPDNY